MFVPDFQELEHKSLCPSLASFKFGSAHTLDIGNIDLTDDMPSFADAPVMVSSRSQPEQANEMDHVDYNDYGGGGGDEQDDDEVGGVDFFAAEEQQTESGQDRRFVFDDGQLASQPLDGAPGSAVVEEIVMSMEDLQHDLFDQFDAKQKGRNWAGPEHWKMRRNAVPTSKKCEEDGTAAKTSRRDKAAFKIDFDAPPPIALDELFAPMPVPKKAASTSAAAAKRSTRGASVASTDKGIRDKAHDFTLPRDYHFNASRLLRLFLKPDMPVRLFPSLPCFQCRLPDERLV